MKAGVKETAMVANGAKLKYEAPKIEAIEMEMEGILCTSGGETPAQGPGASNEIFDRKEEYGWE